MLVLTLCLGIALHFFKEPSYCAAPHDDFRVPRARGESGRKWLAKTIPAFATWVRWVTVLVARILAFSRFGAVRCG
ncbi:hypothetical protein F5888DRAFT_1738549 [Russula emetica]|nr:hypothetical protein F5888DRAFT_1752176 [Russula emetica]KAF8491094.1 hypothetical protein F5888DRAFT_1738549 [Russula emetica]